MSGKRFKGASSKKRSRPSGDWSTRAGGRRSAPKQKTGKARSSASVRAVVQRELRKDFEKKRYDIKSAANVVSAVAVVTRLVDGIAGGGAINQRVGNTIKLQSLLIRFEVWGLDEEVIDNNDSDVAVRYLVVQDRQQVAGSAPALSDVLEDVTEPYILLSPMKVANIQRFKVLRSGVMNMVKIPRKITDVNPVPAPGLSNDISQYRMQTQVVEEFIPLREENQTIKWTSASADAIAANGVYLFIFAQKAATTFNCNIYSRATYVDP